MKHHNIQNKSSLLLFALAKITLVRLHRCLLSPKHDNAYVTHFHILNPRFVLLFACLELECQPYILTLFDPFCNFILFLVEYHPTLSLSLYVVIKKSYVF